MQSKQASLVNLLTLYKRDKTPGDVSMSEDVSDNFPIPQAIHEGVKQATNTAVLFYLEEQTACIIKFGPIFSKREKK